MNYYITGDTHGSFYQISQFCKKIHTTKEDIMIILGDAGINYYLNKRDKELKEELKDLPITLFCIQGNHEKRASAISTYKEIEWKNGIVYQEKAYPNLLFAKDGEIYQFGEKSVFVIGGAYSVDKYYRILRGYKWFEDEQPSEEIKQYAEKQLEKANWKVDIVLSHTVPVKYEPVEVFLSNIDQDTVDKSTEEWLDTIENRLEYEHWYAGHYHTEKEIDKLTIMFHSYKELDISKDKEYELE